MSIRSTTRVPRIRQMATVRGHRAGLPATRARHTDRPGHDATGGDTVPGAVELHARNVSFDWADTPLHWIPGHPVCANYISVLNMLLPEGERWFVRTFNEALPLGKDAELASAMRGFIGQEAMHAETHDKALWEVLERHGIDPRPYQLQMEWVFRKILAPTDSSDPRAQQKHLVERLWLIAAIEHFTAILGDFALNNRWTDVGADPNMVDMFTWHGAEEVEHRCVAHDVATYFADGYFRRARAMLVVTPLLLLLIRRGFVFIMAQDQTLSLNRFQRSLAIWRGVRATVMPNMFATAYQSFSYFRPGFYPDEIGSTAQAVAYLASSPAARRAP